MLRSELRNFPYTTDSASDSSTTSCVQWLLGALTPTAALFQCFETNSATHHKQADFIRLFRPH